MILEWAKPYTNRPMNSSRDIRPIFIVGYMHTGTTLLRKVIGRHSDVYSVRAETMFFDQLANSIARRFPNLSDDAAHEEFIRYLVKMTTFDWPPITEAEARFEVQQLQPDEALIRRIITSARHIRDHTAIFVHVFSSIASAVGKSHWLEKTPSHIFWVDQILAAMPNARIIEMVRDPRDVLASKKTRKNSDWSDRYGEHVGDLMKTSVGYDPLRDSLGWRAAIRAGSKAAREHPDAFLRMRYEDLVSNPEHQTRQLCNYLGIEFEPSMLEVGRSNSTVESGKGREQGIDQSAVGKWRGRITPDIVSLCQMINRDEMKGLRYESQAESFGTRIKALYWIARSGTDLISRYYQLSRARGSGYVLESLRNSLRRVTHLAR